MSHLCFKRTIRLPPFQRTHGPPTEGGASRHTYYNHDFPTEGRKKWPNSSALLTEGGASRHTYYKHATLRRGGRNGQNPDRPPNGGRSVPPHLL